MTLRSFAFALLICPAVVAQQPDLDVSDLLLPEASRAFDDAREIVRRGLPRLKEDGERSARRSVSGEGHLAWWLGPFGSSGARGLYSEGALEAVLAKIRGASDSAVGFSRIGDRALLDTEFAEQVAAALGQVRRALPPRVTVDVTLERVGEDGAVSLLSGEETFRNGETRVISDVVRKQVLYDFDVEIAQAAAIANPIVGDVWHGASVALRARPIPLGEEVVVETVVRVAEPLSVGDLTPSKWFGPMDRVSSRIDEAGLVFRLARDEATQHEWTTLDGGRLRLTCVARWEPADVEVGRDVVVVNSPMFGKPVLGFRSTNRGEPEDYTECTPVLELVERMQIPANSEAMTLHERDELGGGVLLFEGERGRSLARALGARIDGALSRGSIVLEVLDAPADVDVNASGPLPDGVREVARLAGPLLREHPVCLASAREVSYVRDWDAEVAQSSRIPDPKVSMVEEGWFATVRPRSGADGRLDRVEIALELETLQELRSVSTSISSPVAALTEASDLVLPQDIVDVELPVMSSLRVATVVDLDDDGAAVIRRAATTTFGPGRVLVVRIHAE